MKLEEIQQRTGMTLDQCAEKLKERFPKVSKAFLSAAKNEDLTGLKLTKEAEDILLGRKSIWRF